MHRPPEWQNYDAAVAHLAEALCATWRSCDVAGANLPEALSYALGLAARDLGREAATADPEAFEGAPMDQETAVAVLVAQRPGSWEAALVADLTCPVDLLAESPPA